MNDQTTYPVGHQFSVGYNPIEDRLLLTTELKEAGHTTLLLTRRMVLLVMKQILDQLPTLSGLDQTPASYWQEVLELTHQQAVEQHGREANKAQGNPTKTATPTADAAGTQEVEDNARPDRSPASRLFLATELSSQQANDRLHLAFKGLPMSEVMQGAASQVPVLALSLEATHVHQVIQLLITQARKANWHLPVDLPWIHVKTGSQPAQTSSH